MAAVRHDRMAPKKRVPTPGTIWRCPDELWEKVALVLNELDPSADTGRKRIDPRRALDGMIYQLRTGAKGRRSAAPSATTPASTASCTSLRSVKDAVICQECPFNAVRDACSLDIRPCWECSWG